MKSPDKTLDPKDPGDEVALRYHYQHCVAAINSLQLLEESSNVRAIICENHEDVVIAYKDGTYVAAQVKTRKLDQDPFKATDTQVVAAFSRFVALDTRFPDKFKEFDFYTNHIFWKTSENGKNLAFILESLKDRGSLKGLRKTNPIKEFAQTICEASGKNMPQVEAMLLKCVLTSKIDTISSIQKDVVGAVGEIPGFGVFPHTTILDIALKIRALASDSSMSLLKGQVISIHQYGGCLEDVFTDQTLNNKIITRQKIQSIVDECCSSEVSFEQLYSESKISLNDIPKDLAVMIQKMDRGGLHSARITQMSDLVRSVETTYLKWVQKYGKQSADSKLQDLFGIVEFDCTEAFVKHEDFDQDFGSNMFEELKSAFSLRCQMDPEKVYNCRSEHLLGAAGMLTQECKVWWSQKFEPVKVPQ